MIICHYRISPNSTNKARIADKKQCLKSFLVNLSRSFDQVHILGDGCDDDTVSWIKQYVEEYGQSEFFYQWTTDMGNSGTALTVLTLGMSMTPNAEYIYFAEDDYLYASGACFALSQAIDNKLPAFTLYDHPDKYSPMYQGGETCQCIRTQNYHWRSTISTCMTFGIKRTELVKNFAIFTRGCIGRLTPNDHEIWKELTNSGRSPYLFTVLSPVATHAEKRWLSLGRDWETWLLDQA